MYNLYRQSFFYHHQNHSAFPKHNWLGHDQFWHDTQFSSQNLLLLFFESHWVAHCWLDPFVRSKTSLGRQRPRSLVNITHVFESLKVDELVNHGEEPPQGAQFFFRKCNLFFSLNYLASTINAFNPGQ